MTKLKKLTKSELIHLIEMCDNSDLVKAFVRSRKHQKSKGIRCFECESIEKKLEVIYE